MEETVKDLEQKATRINELLKTQNDDSLGKYQIQNGYGRVRLIRVCKLSGIVVDVSRSGFVTKNQLMVLMSVFINGIEKGLQSIQEQVACDVESTEIEIYNASKKFSW